MMIGRKNPLFVTQDMIAQYRKGNLFGHYIKEEIDFQYVTDDENIVLYAHLVLPSSFNQKEEFRLYENNGTLFLLKAKIRDYKKAYEIMDSVNSDNLHESVIVFTTPKGKSNDPYDTLEIRAVLHALIEAKKYSSVKARQDYEDLFTAFAKAVRIRRKRAIHDNIRDKYPEALAEAIIWLRDWKSYLYLTLRIFRWKPIQYVLAIIGLAIFLVVLFGSAVNVLTNRMSIAPFKTSFQVSIALGCFGLAYKLLNKNPTQGKKEDHEQE